MQCSVKDSSWSWLISRSIHKHRTGHDRNRRKTAFKPLLGYTLWFDWLSQKDLIMFIFSSSTYLVFIIWCMSSLLSTHNIQHYKRIQQNPNPIWPRIGKKPFAYKWEKGFPMSNGCFDFFPAKIHFAAFTMSWNKFWRIILIYTIVLTINLQTIIFKIIWIIQNWWNFFGKI